MSDPTERETRPSSGRVLKAGSPGTATPERPVVEVMVFDAKAEAARLLDAARAEAEDLRARAQEDAERLKAQAVAEGRERGLQAVTELLVGARAAAGRARQSAEPELRVLAVRIAQKILGRELSLRPEMVADVVHEALKLAGEPGGLTVRVHPDDLPAVERGRTRLLERCRAGAVCTFRADPAIGRGGCMVETELGIVDARLSTQLDAIERALRGEPG